MILANETTLEKTEVEFMAHKRENDQLKEDIAQKLQDFNKLQATIKADIYRYKASDEEQLLQIVLNDDIQDSNNTNNKGVLPTHNPQPSSPKRVDIEIIHLDFDVISITTESKEAQEQDITNPIVHKPPTNIPLCNEVYENNLLSPHSCDPANTIDDLINAGLNDIDLFEGIDMVTNYRRSPHFVIFGTKRVSRNSGITNFETFFSTKIPNWVQKFRWLLSNFLFPECIPLYRRNFFCKFHCT